MSATLNLRLSSASVLSINISISDVKWFQLNTNNPYKEKAFNKNQNDLKDTFIGDSRNQKSIAQTINEKDNKIDDFYSSHDIYKVDTLDKIQYQRLLKRLNANQARLLNSKKQFYELTFDNIGGLVMPLIINCKFIDGTEETIRIPAEIWRRYEDQVSRIFVFDKEVSSFRLDPFLETADTDLDNNSWPRISTPSRYQLFKQRRSRENPMQRENRIKRMD